VEGAAVRETFQHPADAVVLGCDVASGHGEDSSVIYIRAGLDGRSHLPRKFANLDPLQFAYKIAAAANELGAQGIFVDAGGVGEGTVAKLRELGLAVHAVYFGSKSDNPDGITRCANKRSAMWCAMGQWLKAGAIPNDPELKAQLIGPLYTENPQGIVLERKQDMAARGLGSPDIADALALTFAAPVFSQMSDLPGPGNHLVVSEYDPYSEAAMRNERYPEERRAARYTAPGWSSLRPE
jgi:phage terminase large subunit